jgi:hypothetical protein
MTPGLANLKPPVPFQDPKQLAVFHRPSKVIYLLLPAMPCRKVLGQFYLLQADSSHFSEDGFHDPFINENQQHYAAGLGRETKNFGENQSCGRFSYN